MSSDLAAILTRLRLQPADLTTPSATADGQAELLLARISALTQALAADLSRPRNRDASRASDDFRFAARLLLADLGLVAAHLRGQANGLSASLTAALGGLRQALDLADDAPTGSSSRPQ